MSSHQKKRSTVLLGRHWHPFNLHYGGWTRLPRWWEGLACRQVIIAVLSDRGGPGRGQRAALQRRRLAAQLQPGRHQLQATWHGRRNRHLSADGCSSARAAAGAAQPV